MGDTMREAFEAARRRIDGLPLNTRRRNNGEYGDYGVQRSWELWQAAHEVGRQLGMEQAHALLELSKSSREIEAMPVFWAASWALDDLDKVFAYGNDALIRIWRNPADKTGLSPLYITPPAGDSDTKEN